MIIPVTCRERPIQHRIWTALVPIDSQRKWQCHLYYHLWTNGKLVRCVRKIPSLYELRKGIHLGCAGWKQLYNIIAGFVSWNMLRQQYCICFCIVCYEPDDIAISLMENMLCCCLLVLLWKFLKNRDIYVKESRIQAIILSQKVLPRCLQTNVWFVLGMVLKFYSCWAISNRPDSEVCSAGRKWYM